MKDTFSEITGRINNLFDTNIFKYNFESKFDDICSKFDDISSNFNCTSKLFLKFYITDDNSDSYKINIELPGIGKDNIKLSREDNYIIIKFNSDEKDNIYKIKLRENIGKISSIYKDGLLTIKVSYKEKKSYSIEIN